MFSSVFLQFQWLDNLKSVFISASNNDQIQSNHWLIVARKSNNHSHKLINYDSYLVCPLYNWDKILNPQNLAASVPLLASQLGRPVSLGGRSGLAPHMGAFLPNSISPLYFLPIGNGRIMSRNLNGTSKTEFYSKTEKAAYSNHESNCCLMCNMLNVTFTI